MERKEVARNKYSAINLFMEMSNSKRLAIFINLDAWMKRMCAIMWWWSRVFEEVGLHAQLANGLKTICTCQS